MPFSTATINLTVPAPLLSANDISGAIVVPKPTLIAQDADAYAAITVPSVLSSGESVQSPGYSLEISVPPVVSSGDVLYGWVGSLSRPLPAIRVSALGGPAPLANLVVPAVTLSAEIVPDIDWDAAIVVPTPNLYALMNVEVNEDDYSVWIVNTNNSLHSNYTGLKLNSYVVFDGKEIIATDTGIHELTGDSDNGVPIESEVLWVPTAYGSSSLKRLDAAYVNIRHASDFSLTATADETEKRIYEAQMVGHGEGMHKKRVLLVRGLKGEFWQIGFESRDGFFAISDVEVMPVVSKRRIY